MSGIDIKTLLAVMVLSNLFIVLLFLAYILRYSVKHPNIILFIVGKSLQSITWIIYLAFSTHLDPPEMFFSVLFLFFGLALEMYSLSTVNSGKSKGRLRGLMLLSVISVIIYGIVVSSITYRVAVASCFYMGMFAYLFYASCIGENRSFMQMLIGWVALLFSAAWLVRGLYAVVTMAEITIYTNEAVQILAALIWIIVNLTFPVLYLFLIKEQDNKKLVALNSGKDKLLRIIGHDFRSPISQIIQIADLVSDPAEERTAEKYREYGRVIRDSSARGLDLLDNLLCWANTRTNAVEPNPEEIILSEIAEKSIGYLKLSAEFKNIRIENRIDPDIRIVADPNMLRTVIRNLVSNAIKFTDSGGVVEVGCRMEDAVIMIRIKDTGVGIPEEKLGNLFHQDAGMTTTGTRQEKGSGLGLMICRELVEKMKGEIRVESKVGEGTVFYVRLPK